MAAIFSQILNMSMTGSVVILLVMLARLILKRSPKIFSYALWSVVLFRLLCPVAFTAPVSVLDVVEPEQKETSNNTSIVTYIPATVDTYVDFIAVQPEEQQVQVESVTEPEEQLRMTPMHAVALVWAAGMVGMMLYSVVQYLTLQRKLVGSVQLKGNIYLADHIDTAFVVGLVQPRIYLPSAVPHKERYFILAHEQHHIRRGDHIIKLLAYLALCIHWFNPLVWISFVLAGKDMEMSCDEAVIKRLGPDIRADYSASLLRLATHKKILSGMPLAFGEGDTKGRVLNMAKWKKPAKWVVAICMVLCLSIIVICALNPETTELKVRSHTTWDEPCTTGIDDLVFTYPAGLTSEIRDVVYNPISDAVRDWLERPSRFASEHCFIDNGVDFGGVIHFDLRGDREIQLEELELPSDWAGLTYVTDRSTYPYVDTEYTLIKDGKEYIQLYSYTYSGRGYFIWFYAENGNPVHKHAILESVELGNGEVMRSKLEQDEAVSLGLFNITIPKGYGYYRNEAKILEITKKDLLNNQKLVGCVTAIPNPNLPMDTAEDRVKWVEAIGIDLSYEGKSYGYSITDENEYGDIYVNREELMHGNTVLAENHYIYIAGDIVYDFCINVLEIDSANENVLLDSVWIKERYMSTVPSVDIITNSQLIQYGSLHFSLPDGMEAADENGSIALTFDGRDIGGIALRHPEQPNSPDAFSESWQAAMGVPEASDRTMGYSGGGSLYADYETTYFPDMPVNRDDNGNIIRDEIGTYVLDNEVTHYFFATATDIYDLWLYINRLPNIPREELLKSCYIEGVTDLASKDIARAEEEEALSKCRAVIEAVQQGSYKIVTQHTSGRNESAVSHEWIYSRNGSDWLSITNVLPMGADFNDDVEYAATNSALCTNGQHYKDTGTEWVETANQEDSRLPWLADFSWDENIISYQGTIEDSGAVFVMLRVDEKYLNSDEYGPHYFVDFSFMPGGEFVSVRLSVNLFQDNQLTIRESLVSLDPKIVNAEIQKEYFNAIA